MSKIRKSVERFLGNIIDFIVEHDEGIFTTLFLMIVGTTVIGFFVVVGKFIDHSNTQHRELIDEQNRLLSEYYNAHHCERAGFAGRYPEPYFKCDNGIWLTEELIQLRKTELLQESRK